MVETILLQRKRKRTSSFSFLFLSSCLIRHYWYFIYRDLIKMSYMFIEINKEINRKGNRQINKSQELTKILHA